MYFYGVVSLLLAPEGLYVTGIGPLIVLWIINMFLIFLFMCGLCFWWFFVVRPFILHLFLLF